MELDEIRQKIDRIDGQMQELFVRRMDLAAAVIEAKKKTGEAVYAPGREQDVLALRGQGIRAELLPECRMFFRRLMEISRAFQYAGLTEEKEQLSCLPKGVGGIAVSFLDPQGELLPVFLQTAMLAGLEAQEVMAKREKEDMRCRMVLSGDFSSERAKAAVLQILGEGMEAEILEEAG